MNNHSIPLVANADNTTTTNPFVEVEPSRCSVSILPCHTPPSLSLVADFDVRNGAPGNAMHIADLSVCHWLWLDGICGSFLS